MIRSIDFAYTGIAILSINYDLYKITLKYPNNEKRLIYERNY